MRAVSAMPAVHEEMDQRTTNEEQIGNDAKHVGAVLLPQENSGNRREGTERDPDRAAVTSGLLVFQMCGHDGAPVDARGNARADGLRRDHSRTARFCGVMSI